MNIDELVKVPLERRDTQWEDQFCAVLPHSKLRILAEQPQPGPDSWPYLFVSTEGELTEPATDIIDWLSTRGIGLAVNPDKPLPDFVLTYGMIWNFRQRGTFVNKIENIPTGEVQFAAGSRVLAGPASEDYLPGYVRKIVRQFFLDQQVYSPAILVMSSDKKQFDLCISLESIGNPPVTEHEGIAAALGWFLPADYSIVLISEVGLPKFETV